MKFLFHLNVPSGSNDLVHQVVGEVPAVKSLDDLHALMCDLTFIKLRLMFYNRQPDGKKTWTDKGEMLLSTEHISKVQIYIS